MSAYEIRIDPSKTNWTYRVFNVERNYEVGGFPTREKAQAHIDDLEETFSPYGWWRTNLIFNDLWNTEEGRAELRREHPDFVARYEDEIAESRKGRTPVISESLERPERTRVFVAHTRVRSCLSLLHGLTGSIVELTPGSGVEGLFLVRMDYKENKEHPVFWHTETDMVLEDEAAPRIRLPEELEFKGKYEVGTILPHREDNEQGEYRVVKSYFVDAETSAFLEEANDVFDMYGDYSTAVLISQERMKK